MDVNEYAAPPPPTNYKVDYTYSQDHSRFSYVPGPGDGRGKVTCTECSDVIAEDVAFEHIQEGKWIMRKTTAHNAMHHKSLLYVLTSAGWMRARDLIPDPVKQINDVIDQSVTNSVNSLRR